MTNCTRCFGHCVGKESGAVFRFRRKECHEQLVMSVMVRKQDVATYAAYLPSLILQMGKLII